MSHRKCFTVNEALKSLLEEDEAEVFGEEEESDASDVSVQSDDGDDDGDDDDDGEHFLEQRVDVDSAAELYVGKAEPKPPQASSAAACEATVAPAEEDDTVRQKENCGCSKNCLQQFDPADIETSILNMREMESHESELVVLGLLEALSNPETVFESGEKRKRERFTYKFQGLTVCVGAFRHVYALSSKRLKRYRSHLEKNGLVPLVHGNTGKRPHNVLEFAVVKYCVEYITRHAEVFGIPHPAPLRGRDDTPPIFLPASQTYKSVHADFCDCCHKEGKKSVSLSTFRSIWHQTLPHIKFMTARMDVCPVCEDLRRNVMAAGSEEQKTTACIS
eukprot:scpid33038/ scgid20531/ 